MPISLPKLMVVAITHNKVLGDNLTNQNRVVGHYNRLIDSFFQTKQQPENHYNIHTDSPALQH